MDDLQQYCSDVARRACRAAAQLAGIGGAQKQDWLNRCVGLLDERRAELIAANQRDIAAAPGFG
ncbi:MAG: gamma-glutamyl-phosphate reductase, partial [Thermoguttaceae bacterium]